MSMCKQSLKKLQPSTIACSDSRAIQPSSTVVRLQTLESRKQLNKLQYCFRASPCGSACWSKGQPIKYGRNSRHALMHQVSSCQSISFCSAKEPQLCCFCCTHIFTRLPVAAQQCCCDPSKVLCFLSTAFAHERHPNKHDRLADSKLSPEIFVDLKPDFALSRFCCTICAPSQFPKPLNCFASDKKNNPLSLLSHGSSAFWCICQRFL